MKKDSGFSRSFAVANTTVNVACMKWGTMYNGPYVNNLYSMVERHLTIPHRFVCFTDDNRGFIKGIESFPLPGPDLMGGGRFGSWNKVALFASKLADLTGPTLFLDLDLLVVSSMDCFFEYQPGQFCIIHDWSRRQEGNSSVFRFEVGQHVTLLDYFQKHQEEVRCNYRCDQSYVSDALQKSGQLRYWPESWCCSFKRHCLAKWPIHWFATAKLSPESKVVVFHGRPKPPDAAKGTRSKLRYIHPVPWVAEHWHSKDAAA
jgi:hypothetical protein